MYIDGVIDYEAGFHSDLPDVFDSEIIVKADFVCSSPVKIMCVCYQLIRVHILKRIMFGMCL